MFISKTILIHKNKKTLEDIVSQLSRFCVSMEFVSNTILMIESYLTTEEVGEVCKSSNIKVFDVEKDVLNIDAVLDKISKTGIDSLRTEEYYFLTLNSQE